MYLIIFLNRNLASVFYIVLFLPGFLNLLLFLRLNMEAMEMFSTTFLKEVNEASKQKLSTLSAVKISPYESYYILI